jgi:hypothetical protein
MKSTLLCIALTLGVGFPSIIQAKAKKQESEVTKALKDAYPDAKTQITGTNEVNGVKVYDVTVTTKQGESNAQITDYGDFLMYGVPHEYGAVDTLISNNVSGLFKSKPEDVEMYRVTDYYVDFKNPTGKPFTAKFDAVGRLKDISNAREIGEESKQARGKQITDAADLKKAAGYVKREMPGAEVAAVYAAGQDGGFWYIQTKDGGDLVANKDGQVLSLRHPITATDFPEPVAKTIQGMFNAPIDKLWRGEEEYYQFNQQSQTGQPIVVKMRPNGDILEVRNDAVAQDEQAQQAKAKEKAKSSKKKG